MMRTVGVSRRHAAVTCAVACAVALAACASGHEREHAGPGAVTALTVGDGTGGDAGGSEPGTVEDDGEDASDGPGSSSAAEGGKFDVGAAGDEGAAPPSSGCEIDFLFVIDNSDSMADKQAQLVGAFPGFMNAIEANVDSDDYHVMVVDTDAWGKCNPGDCSGDVCKDPVAGKYICETNFEACDKTLGAGVLHPAGRFATNAPCSPAGGHRYIEAGEPDLVGTFTCMATVGTAGNGAERPMDALVAAVDPTINQAGGCNEGFLRDDAILVVMFISDDPWLEDHGEPQDWYDAVVAAKNGELEKIVVLGMTPAWPGCRDGKGPPKGEHWKSFVELWGDHGLHGNVCGTAEEYVDFFEAAIATIDATCDANPVG